MSVRLVLPGIFANLRRVSARMYDCPQCGAPVKFQSSIAVFAVCSFCRSMVVRKDARIEWIGEMAELPPDLSPLQIGTRGEWKGKPFQLIGRIRVSWEQGSWTEWCAMFPNDETGWVADSQGMFMVTVFNDIAEQLPLDVTQFRAGQGLRLGKHSWQIVDVKQVTCLAGEGELPFVAPPGTRRLNADLAGTGPACGTVEFHESGPEVYLGEYAEFEQLNFTNLRPVPGWDGDAEQIRHRTAALNCVSCGAVVELRAPGLTQSAVCGSCGTVVDTANPLLRVIQSSSTKALEVMTKMQVLIPIGTRGTLHGTEWEVIGIQTRADRYSKWTEYLLFNPWRGFRWLVYFGGHWSFVRQLMGKPAHAEGQRLRYDGSRFALFARDKAEVRAVLGEFYWKVQRGEVAHVSDFVSPPRILSWETYPELNEHTWSLGEYVEPDVIKQAFGLEKLPRRIGIYLNQPNPWRARWRSICGWALLFITLFCGIQFLFATRGERQPVWQGSFVFDRSAANKIAVTPSFHVNAQQPLAIDVYADVNNNWIGFDAEVVNAKTNEAFPVEINVEFYSGYDDGYWSEGGKNTRVVIPSVPAGDYFVNFEPEADPSIATLPYQVTVAPGGLFWSNFWIGLLTLCAYPGFVLWRRHAWEVERWSESDFSPYASSSSDD